MEDTRSLRHATTDFVSEDSADKFKAYYCFYCGAFACITDCKLAIQPRRQTDGSMVVKQEHIKKSNLVKKEVKAIKRTNHFERQYRWACPDCKLFVAYQSQDWNTSSNELVYFLDLALCANPNVVVRHQTENAIPGCIEEGTVGRVSITLSLLPQSKYCEIKDVNAKGCVMHVKSEIHDGAAIKEAGQYLAKCFGVKKSQISLELNRLHVLGVTPTEIYKKILCAIA